MKKKYIILIVTIVAIFLILYLSLTQIVPARIKPLLIEVIHNYTGKPVEIENIAFSLFRGLIVRNLTVQNLFANLPLKFSRINLSLKYPPLILQRKVVYRLSSTPAEIFNFQITSSGTFKLADKSLTSQINIGLPLGLLKFILRDTPWEIKGEKLNLSINLQIDAQRNILADIEVPLRNISLLISQYTFSGAGEINLNISKPAKSGKTNYKGKVKIEELSTTIPKEGEKFTLRDGDIDFDLRNIQINKLECKYLERTYLLKGTIKNLNRPEISLDITSEMLESKINFSYLQNSLDIKSVILKLPQSKLELQGLINDLKNLRGDIYLSGSIHTEDLKYLPFKLLSRSKGVSSLLNLEAYISGELREWKKWTSLVKIDSPQIKINQYEIENAEIEIKTKEGFLNGELKANAYEGELVIDVKELSLRDNFPFLGNLIMEEINLQRLSEDSLKIERKIAGLFHGELTCRGEIKKIKEINGEGWFEVTDGLLWELPVLSKLSKIIEIPGIEKNAFREAHANFVVKDQRVTTQDLELISKRLTLKTQGSISLNGDLDLKVRIEFPPEEKPEGTWDKIQDILLKGTGNLIKEIQIKGTIKNPEYKILPAIENIFQNILQ